jgi:hypothetical protein
MDVDRDRYFHYTNLARRFCKLLVYGGYVTKVSIKSIEEIVQRRLVMFSFEYSNSNQLNAICNIDFDYSFLETLSEYELIDFMKSNFLQFVHCKENPIQESLSQKTFRRLRFK